MKIFVSLLFLAATAASAAADGPGDLGMTRGALVVGGELLFVSDGDGANPCARPCSATPFLAAPESVASGLWTLAPTEGGVQWVYDGQPLFRWPEIGANFGYYFYNYDYVAAYYGLRPTTIRDPVAEGLAMAQDDLRVVSAARIERRTIVNYGLYNDTADAGAVEVSACVDQRGRSGPVAITSSSGSAGLDAITLEFAQKAQFVPARDAAGDAVAVCGIAIRLVFPDIAGADARGRAPTVVLPAS